MHYSPLFYRRSMKRLLSQNELISRILRDQRPSGPVKKSIYCLTAPCDDGELWYNNLTGELLLLDDSDLKALNEPEGRIKDELVRKRFLVPVTENEKKLADQIRALVSLMERKEKEITRYTIFPTTDCNARCFYCYELGIRRYDMSESVAHDTAAFIMDQSDHEKVRIEWFGGEPLCNFKAIDIVSEDLKDNHADFSSIMVSNGYLFDEEMINDAVKKWNLESVQITLDGTEDIYNKTKAYMHKSESPYRRVLRNIGLLLDAGVSVDVRLNMDQRNADDLSVLADELAERFKGRNGFSAYTVLLRDFGQRINRFDNDEEGLRCYRSLQEKLIRLGIGKKAGIEREYSNNQCMADNDHAVTILPDGGSANVNMTAKRIWSEISMRALLIRFL